MQYKYSSIREEWQKFYKLHFNWDVDFSQVIIPLMPIRRGKWRLLFIPKGMTLELAFKICEKFFSRRTSFLNNLDKLFSKNSRNTNNQYAVWIRDDGKLNTKFLRKSTDKVDPNMKIGITLLERMILEIKYFTETRKHFGAKYLTICSGSRNNNGNVPYMYLDYCGDIYIGDYYLWISDSMGGIREVVSL